MTINLNIIRRSSGLYTPSMPMEDNILYFTKNYDIIAHYVYLPPAPNEQEKRIYIEDCCLNPDYISEARSGLQSNPEQEACRMAENPNIVTPTDGKVINPRKERHWILPPKVCRFCGKKIPEVTFKKQAHALSELIGNKTITLRNECDTCNALFSSYESDFANYFGVASRTLSQIEGKHAVPVYKSDTTRLEKGKDKIVMQEVSGKETLSICGNTATISTIKASYIPLSVYKTLVVMSLSIMPEVEFNSFLETTDWLLGVRESDFFTRCASRVLYRFIPGLKPLPVQAWLLRRKSILSGGTYDCPYCHFILEFANYSFQIVIPNIRKDVLLQSPIIMMFPGTVDAIPNIAKDEVINRIINLSNPNKVENERLDVSFHFDEIIPLDTKQLGSLQDIAKREGVKPLTLPDN